MKKGTKKVGVLGHFGFGLNMTDGQTVKTLTVAKALQERCGEDEVLCADTHGGAKALPKLPFQVIKLLKKTNNVVILPAQRGVQVIVPLLAFFNRFFRRRLHYCVVGGWLPRLVADKKRLVRALKCFDGLYAETSAVRRGLLELGLQNVWMAPNCKQLHIAGDKPKKPNQTLRLCTFSRVMKEKGIQEAADAVNRLNSLCPNAATLDIYGAVAPAQTEWFAAFQKQMPEGVRYCGEVSYDKSVETLAPYDALLFPTRFFTEGIPGTVIDAYAAGLPVIAAKWESFSDIIDDGVTGIGYGFDEEEGLYNALVYAHENREALAAMQPACLKKAEDYLPENALAALFERIGD